MESRDWSSDVCSSDLERVDLDPRFHQSLSPLGEGNPLDLDLGVLGVLLLVLPLIFLPSISCFGGI